MSFPHRSTIDAEASANYRLYMLSGDHNSVAFVSLSYFFELVGWATT